MTFADVLLANDPSGHWAATAAVTAEQDTDTTSYEVWSRARKHEPARLVETVVGRWRAELVVADNADASGRLLSDFEIVPVTQAVAA